MFPPHRPVLHAGIASPLELALDPVFVLLMHPF
jgi:hypothetical protein